MLMTDEEKQKLENLMIFNNYSTYETDYFDSQSYSKLRTTMLEYFPNGNLERFEFDFFTKSEMLEDGKYIIDKHFGKLDLRVPYADCDNMQSQLVAVFGKKPTPDKYDEIIEYINRKIKLVDVTDIPVRLDLHNPTNGFVSSTIFYSPDDMEKDFYKKLPVCLREIEVSGNCDDNAKCIYVHEMAHALINRNKGSIYNLLDKEVFSIFMEKVAAKELDLSNELLDAKTLYRFFQTKHNMLDKEILESKTYVLSTLKATALFNTYAKGSKKVQKEIDDSLGRVITGKDTLEDVLYRYEATPEKGSKVMQRQIKTLSKKYC